MTTDERIDRLVERHEALAESVQMLHSSLTEAHASLTEAHASIVELREGMGRLLAVAEHNTNAIGALARIAEIHGKRLDDLEGGSQKLQ